MTVQAKNDAKDSPYMKKDIYSKLTKEATKLVEDYVVEHHEDDPDVEFEVFVVWQCHLLGNRKWLISTTLSEGMYYEVTYDSYRGFYYLDAYKRTESKMIPIYEVRKQQTAESKVLDED